MSRVRIRENLSARQACHNPIECNLTIGSTQLVKFFFIIIILSSFLPDLF